MVNEIIVICSFRNRVLLLCGTKVEGRCKVSVTAGIHFSYGRDSFRLRWKYISVTRKISVPGLSKRRISSIFAAKIKSYECKSERVFVGSDSRCYVRYESVVCTSVVQNGYES